jgi:hypothetical protein
MLVMLTHVRNNNSCPAHFLVYPALLVSLHVFSIPCHHHRASNDDNGSVLSYLSFSNDGLAISLEPMFEIIGAVVTELAGQCTDSGGKGNKKGSSSSSSLASDDQFRNIMDRFRKTENIKVDDNDHHHYHHHDNDNAVSRKNKKRKKRKHLCCCFRANNSSNSSSSSSLLSLHNYDDVKILGHGDAIAAAERDNDDDDVFAGIRLIRNLYFPDNNINHDDDLLSPTTSDNEEDKNISSNHHPHFMLPWLLTSFVHHLNRLHPIIMAITDLCLFNTNAGGDGDGGHGLFNIIHASVALFILNSDSIKNHFKTILKSELVHVLDDDNDDDQAMIYQAMIGKDDGHHRVLQLSERHHGDEELFDTIRTMMHTFLLKLPAMMVLTGGSTGDKFGTVKRHHHNHGRADEIRLRCWLEMTKILSLKYPITVTASRSTSSCCSTRFYLQIKKSLQTLNTRTRMETFDADKENVDDDDGGGVITDDVNHDDDNNRIISLNHDSNFLLMFLLVFANKFYRLFRKMKNKISTRRKIIIILFLTIIVAVVCFQRFVVEHIQKNQIDEL